MDSRSSEPNSKRCAFIRFDSSQFDSGFICGECCVYVYRAASYRIVFVRSSSVSARYSDDDDGGEVMEVVVIDDTYIHSYVRTHTSIHTRIPVSTYRYGYRYVPTHSTD